MEVSVLAVMMLVEGVITIPNGAILELLAATLIASSALLRRTRPRLSWGTLCAAIVVSSLVPPEQIAMSVYLPLVGVLFLSQAGSFASASVLASCGFALSLWASRRAATLTQWGSVAILWLVVYGAALSIGGILRQSTIRGERQHLDELAAQRRRIAAELHDTVAHDLTLMVLRAESANRALETAPEELVRIAESGRRANEQLRRMMLLLHVSDSVRPMSLEGSLIQAQRDLAKDGLEATVSVEGALEAVGERTSDCLARVLKEAVNNMVRHADPAHPCSIFIEVRDGQVHMVILNRRSHPERPVGMGIGLEGMAQRLGSINGTLRTGPQGGLWLVGVTAPLGD